MVAGLTRRLLFLGAALLLAPALAGCGGGAGAAGAGRLRVELSAEQARQAGLEAVGEAAVGPDGMIYLATAANVVRFNPRLRTLEPLVADAVGDLRDVAVAEDGVVLLLREREVSACLDGCLLRIVALPGQGLLLAAAAEGFYVAVRDANGVHRVLRYLYRSKTLESLLASDDQPGALAAAPGGCLVAAGGNLFAVSDPVPPAGGAGAGPAEAQVRLVLGLSEPIRSAAGDPQSGFLYFSDGEMTYALAEGKILPLLPVGGRLALRGDALTICRASPTQVLRLEGASGRVRELLKPPPPPPPPPAQPEVQPGG